MSSHHLSAEAFTKELLSYQSSIEKKKYERYFPGDDSFFGVRMGQVFALAKQYIAMEIPEIEKLLESDTHEVRVGAVSIMDFQARDKKTSDERKKELFDLYLTHHDRINTWDLVDRSAIYVIGGYLNDKPRDVLYSLAKSRKMYEKRTAIIATAYFMKHKDTHDTFKIAEILVADTDPLVQKAVGWMLRVAGDVDRPGFLHFLHAYAATMPRTMLRYAIEKLDKEQRVRYLAMSKNNTT